ncbi:AAA family ATPase [Steroidobacter flavus]|uniref:AAA family ATPase n=1 Tax=Steroidobacter flavus TaxID=1842136 RepID=A0ABV8STN0_9GAMM
MQKIVVLNPKGGSGKTTIATNLASYFAVEKLRPTLMDMDAQGSSTHWLSKRTQEQALIHGIAAYERNTGLTRSFATRLPLDTQRLVVDTPAAVEPQKLPDITRNATAVLVPVLPSDIDIHAAAKCISNLLLIAKLRRDEQRIAVIANRVKKQTLIYKSLMKFLENLQIPVIATLRDSQAYIRSAEIGLGVFEMKPNSVREDLEQWLPLVGWLAQRKPLHIEPGTPAITSALTSSPMTATTSLESIMPPVAASKPSLAQTPQVTAATPTLARALAAAPAPVRPKPALPVSPSTPQPQLSPAAVVNAIASPASALAPRVGSKSDKIERSESLLPSLLRRVFR